LRSYGVGAMVFALVCSTCQSLRLRSARQRQSSMPSRDGVAATLFYEGQRVKAPDNTRGTVESVSVHDEACEHVLVAWDSGERSTWHVSSDLKKVRS
jgi:hypothetical protein